MHAGRESEGEWRRESGCMERVRVKERERQRERVCEAECVSEIKVERVEEN